MRKLVLIPIAILLFNAFFLENLTTRALHDFDEARYAEVAKNMVKTGNYAMPMAGGPFEPQDTVTAVIDGYELYPYLWKPVFHPFVVAISMNIFGINEFAVRFPPLVFAIGSVVVFYMLMQRLMQDMVNKTHTKKNERRIAVEGVPLIASLFFISVNDFLVLSSQGLAEMMFLFFSLSSIYILLHKKFRWSILEDRRIVYFVAGIFWGLAFLTKSFAAFWPPIIATLYALRFEKWRFNILIWYGLGAMLTVLPWLVYMYISIGDVFVDWFVRQSVFERVGGEGVSEVNNAPFYWYGIYQLDFWKPYVLLSGVTAGVLISRSFSKVVLTWGIVFVSVLSFFSYSVSKVWWYIFPSWPALAALTAVMFFVVWKKREALLVGIVGMLLALSIHPFWQLNIRHIPVTEFALLWIATFIISLLLAHFGTKLKVSSHKSTVIVGMLLLMTFVSGYYHVYKKSSERTDTRRPVKVLGERYKGLAPLGIKGLPYESISFYFDPITVMPLEKAEYMVVHNDLKDQLARDWEVIDQEDHVVLMKRK